MLGVLVAGFAIMLMVRMMSVMSIRCHHHIIGRHRSVDATRRTQRRAQANRQQQREHQKRATTMIHYLNWP